MYFCNEMQNLWEDPELDESKTQDEDPRLSHFLRKVIYSTDGNRQNIKLIRNEQQSVCHQKNRESKVVVNLWREKKLLETLQSITHSTSTVYSSFFAINNKTHY